MSEMIEELKETIFELKFDAWESDRNTNDYARGYWWGIYSACREIEKVLGIYINVTQKPKEIKKNRSNLK